VSFEPALTQERLEKLTVAGDVTKGVQEETRQVASETGGGSNDNGTNKPEEDSGVKHKSTSDVVRELGGDGERRRGKNLANNTDHTGLPGLLEAVEGMGLVCTEDSGTEADGLVQCSCCSCCKV
jgi:hypothetical protein